MFGLTIIGGIVITTLAFVDETIDICINKLFWNSETLINGISKNNFGNLLNLATKESIQQQVLYSSRWCCHGVPSRSNIS